MRLLWPYLKPQRALLWNLCSQWGTLISRSFPYCSSFLLYTDFSFQYAGAKTTQRNGRYQVWWTNVLPNRLLMVGRHMGTELDKIKPMVTFLRKSQSRQSLQVLFLCSVLHLGDSCRRCATLGGVTSVVPLENWGQCSVPASVLPLHCLRLHWSFYHMKDHCRSVSGVGFMEGVTTSYLTTHYDYETGLKYPFLWIWCWEATKQSTLPLKTSAWPARKSQAVWAECFLSYLAVHKNRLRQTLVNTANAHGDTAQFYSGDLNGEYREAVGGWQRKVHTETG